MLCWRHGGSGSPRTWAGAPPWARVDRIGVAAVSGNPDTVDARVRGRQAVPSARPAVPGGGCGCWRQSRRHRRLCCGCGLSSVLLDYGYPAIVVVGVEIAGSFVLRLAMRPVAEGFVLRKPAAADEYREFGALWNFVREVPFVFDQPRHNFSP